MSGQFKKFVSEEEVHEQRQKRQEEWEKVRQPDDPVECPEEETRSLFDQLQANKDVKDRELEEDSRLRSSVKGLDDEEVQFLNYVSNRQMQIEKDRNSEEQSVIKELKSKSVITVEDKKRASATASSSSTSSSSGSSSSKKSQLQLLSGAIKRKSTDSKSETDEKKAKPDEEEERPDAKLMANLPPSNGMMQVAGILPGIADYDDEDSSTENTSNSSDSEADHVIMPNKAVQRVLQEIAQKMKAENK
ncbi:PSME3-interacting protein [Aplysia californica]|uniref:PSME3-interacting protein n=1 Tax=Aplysia californica TaxID=6500 RepID=A0ABM0K517_APLCA|nr:PSME3-interacting protein [Aplysia californica]